MTSPYQCYNTIFPILNLLLLDRGGTGMKAMTKEIIFSSPLINFFFPFKQEKH